VAEVAIIQRFLPSVSRGGVGYFTDGLARALVRRGHQVTVFSQDPQPAGAPYQVTRVPVQDGRLAPLWFPFALRRCDFSKFDVIHAQGDDQWLPRRRPPVVRTMHGTSLAEAWFNGVVAFSPRRFLMHLWFFVGEWIAALRADALVAVSSHTLRFYPRAGEVIPNGVDLTGLSPDPAAKSAHPIVLFVGEVDSRKRGRVLMDAMRTVRTSLPAAELWLVGPDVIVEPGVRSWGRVDDETLHRLLRSAWVMCLPSAYEGFGRPYVEAMASGTAVVATPNPGSSDVLRDGRLGVIVPPAQLADALLRLLQSPAERARLEEVALADVARYDWTNVVAQYEAVYSRVMGRTHA
jgi:phosphatidyl-myo-inositol alpha-mannosyltransferase